MCIEKVRNDNYLCHYLVRNCWSTLSPRAREKLQQEKGIVIRTWIWTTKSFKPLLRKKHFKITFNLCIHLVICCFWTHLVMLRDSSSFFTQEIIPGAALGTIWNWNWFNHVQGKHLTGCTTSTNLTVDKNLMLGQVLWNIIKWTLAHIFTWILHS